LSFTIAAGPRQRSNSQILVSRDHDHILLSQPRDSSNLEGQVTVFISPRKRVTRLYPQALGYFSKQSRLSSMSLSLVLRPTDSQSVSLGVEPHLGLMTRYTSILLFDNYGLALVGRPL
jgi:hypothetical protein